MSYRGKDIGNVAVLSTCQMLFGTGRGLFMVTAPAVALLPGFAPHLALATLPAAAVVIGTALSAWAASMISRRTGRRAGFLIGTGLATVSGALCFSAVIYMNFWLLSVGGLVFGFYSGFAQLYRFAAADGISERYRSVAISLVLAGGVFSGFAGAGLAIWGENMVPDSWYSGDVRQFGGTFMFLTGTAVVAAMALVFLRIPNLTKSQLEGEQRPMSKIMRQPVFIAAAISATVGQTVMNFLMTATPIAMISICGHSFGATANVIAWHTFAMFAPGVFTGFLIRKFGEVTIIMVGLLLEAACIGIALSGIEVFDFWLSMFLLGVGWNFTFTAATSLMTTAYTPAERAKTQGMMNQIIYTVVACGSLSSGAFIHFFGWNWVNIGAMPLLLIAATVTLWYAANGKKIALPT
ncbi:MAG: MFS transporter [Rhodospirillaceae bacterium TMED63]|nr:MFS transporter [Rhodospirillaceae bacterium]RPG02820.1 MAG: MFS transporter [Rhodospirillaceae bacterium TMED63]